MRSVELVRDASAEGAFPISVETTSRADEVDLLRGQMYDLLAALVGRAATSDVLDYLATLPRESTVLGAALTALRDEAVRAEAKAVERAYFDLFIGVGRGDLVPFASYYLTGFLNERPLARVREDLARLGIERAEGLNDPEDHVAILLETMAGLAAGRFDAEPGSDRIFFERHLKPWAARFFGDVAGNGRSPFYGAVGALGRCFIEIETDAYALDA